ncbi:isoprenylcysteine carboxylmethyltransferase family protein [Arachnia propionica]|uniref:Isoprenylcysteine carboxylmethyltransferase family protein n=1 Tax=Arachnia propionica TaxID=1750 RepID=A0A3P1T734_9ACTN|nr:methyltransferase [Arachnia propionica]MDO5084004.1 methyltransferase [Arachnia propionica]RRD05204.1 isoprenylcysteine carboxylmethyltransferase family protein [Arachnia propionica]RRD48829.1 isoprenylcysteine carboxylmethyltransferase family protein [Arachnia propionica]
MRIPPVVLLLAAATVQHGICRGQKGTWGSAAASTPWWAAAAWLIGGSVLRFRAQRTTVDPVDVGAVRSLVTSGPNQVTRNPMYVGMTSALVAHALLRRSAVALLPAAAFGLVIDRLQIPEEEAALAEAFADDFEQYRREVPRWVNTHSVRKLLAAAIRATGRR